MRWANVRRRSFRFRGVFIMREAIIYGEQAVRAVGVAGAQDVSTPVAGFYRYRLRGGSVRGGIHIWFGPPSDPLTGEIMDRSWRWQAEFDGEPADFEEVWPGCTGEPISEQDYRAFVGRREWAKRNAPMSAFADPKRRYDPLSASEPLPF